MDKELQTKKSYSLCGSYAGLMDKKTQGKRLYRLCVNYTDLDEVIIYIPIKEDGVYNKDLNNCLSNIDAYTTKYKKAELMRMYYNDGLLPYPPNKNTKLMVSYKHNYKQKEEKRLLEAAGNKFPELNRYLEINCNQVKATANFKMFFNDYLKVIKDPIYFDLTNKCYIDFFKYEKSFLTLIISYYRLSRSTDPYDQQFIIELAESVRGSLLSSYKTFRNTYITYHNYVFAMNKKYEQETNYSYLEQQSQLNQSQPLRDSFERNYDADPVYEENRAMYEDIEDKPKTI